MKRKFIILFIACILFSNFCNAETNEMQNDKLARKMERFFVQTLIDNYGYNKDEILYRIFFENFYRNDGEYFLSVNRKKIANLNEELFQDSAYYYFYVETYYVSSPDSISFLQNKLEENGHTNVAVSLRLDKYRGTVADSKYNIRLNENGFLKYNIFNESTNSEILKNIQQLWEAKGKEQNMFEFIELALAKPDELTNPEVKAFLTLVFWKYMCYCTNYDLNGRIKKGKYEIN